MDVKRRGPRFALAGTVLAPIAASVALLGLVGVPPALAARSGGDSISAAQMRHARGFWTPARIERARDPRWTGRSGQGQPGSSGPTAKALPGGSATPTSPTKPTTDFGEVADPTSPEFRQNGVILFEAEGVPDRCSGTAVDSANMSVVITAGHCVNSGGGRGNWYDRYWVFIPGYRYGQRPYGVFPAKWLDSTRPWLRSGSENADVGIAVVGRNERDQRLTKAVGGAGITWGLSANQVFDVHGYPAGPPFDGETQRLCSHRPFVGHDATSFFDDGPLNLSVECDVTGGASGGGWTIGEDVLNGVTDYGYSEDPATDFGSYFGEEVGRLYKRASRIR